MKKLFIALMAVTLAAPAFSADDKKADTGKDKTWFETTLQTLKSKTARRFKSSSVKLSNAAAVRGADMNANPEKPAWKGGKSAKANKKTEAELTQITAALELAVAGKNDEASAALGKFIKDNPSSCYLPEAKEALGKLPAAAVKEETPAAKSADEKPADTPSK